MANSKINNSLSTFLEQALVLEKNSIETISKVSEAITSTTNDSAVKLTLTDPNDTSNEITYYIPSFGYLKSQIDRLESTLNTIANLDSNTSGSKIRLSDGTYRKIITSRVPTEAPTITSVNNITNFNFKSNWFFEDMLNPALYVTWDMSNQISEDTERVMIQRYILKCDTKIKQNAFNTTLKGRNDIDYNEFLKFIVNNKIRYTLDDEVKDLPPRSRRYYGSFNVIRAVTETDVNESNVIRYELQSLEYTDSKSTSKNTRLLSVGDIVEVVKSSGNISTRYKVVYANTSENKIQLQCIEGTDPVKIGVGTLRISADQDTEVSADITVGFDEREVIFVKPIDPYSNIPANEWSPGVAFYTNDLTYVDSTGTTQTLQRFYQKNVIDFGQILLSYSTDYYPSIREGLKPNAPTLNYANGSGDFRIVQINNQLSEGSNAENLRSLVADKANVQSQIDSINKQIAAQKEAIQTTNYTTETEKSNATTALNTLVSNQATLVSNYTSIVNSIKAKYDTTENTNPKYRVRGFWDMPDSRVSDSSGEQKIIKFKIRYRYLSNSGNTNREEEFTYSSNGVNVTGRFANWIETESLLRGRVKTSTGWEWEDIDTSDPDKININQLDIPIQKGEQVEIQVKSVSEAGWPSNPMESDWSDSIVVAFSDFAELEADDIEEIIEQNRVDASLANITSLFSSSNEHMSSSFYTNDKYFAHTADTITSGFLSAEQTPITLYDKLKDLSDQIDKLREYINQAEGKVNVCLVDDSNQKVYTLDNGSTTYINAGSYVDGISNLDSSEKNGAIVTKVYYVEITSSLKSGLYLLSKLAGNRTSMCPNTISTDDIDNVDVESYDHNYYDYYDNIINPTNSSSNYYNERGRYDLVPINLSNSDVIDFQVSCPNMYQSAQCKGQFIYSRFRDIGDTFDMYANTSDGSYGVFKADGEFTDSELSYFISDSMRNKYYGEDYKKVVDEYNSLTASGVEYNDFEQEWYFPEKMIYYLNRLPRTWIKKPNSSKTLLRDKKMIMRVANTNTKKLSGQVQTSTKLMQRVENLTNNTTSINHVEPKIQSAYGFGDLGKIHGKLFETSTDTEDDGSYLTTHKIGFEDKDKYAGGVDTCNSFLFLSPVSHSDIQVDGDTQESKKQVESETAIRVPIVYQFRMTDVNGYIFGNSANDPTSSEVKNTVYANIIGLDIWTTNDWGKPSQYDIVVYSTYGNSLSVDTSKQTTSTQSLVNAIKAYSNTAQQMIKNAQSTVSV